MGVIWRVGNHSAHDEDELGAEAQAFNQRIEEREANGFTPDLRNLVPNDHFYKSFWRDPFYADLYVGEMSRTFVSQFAKHLEPGSRILDAGCGAGYFSLELARSGFEVVGVDIARSAIEAATRARDSAVLRGEVVELQYEVADPKSLVADFRGSFQGVLCSGFLHHIPDVESQMEALAQLLEPQGVLVMHEPQHELFTPQDAFWVGVVRELLKLTENWYETEPKARTWSDLNEMERAVHQEYVTERDPDEPGGQSPNDLSADRRSILRATEMYFDLLEDFPSRSFIYRTLGGLRGNATSNRDIATFLSELDTYAVEAGYLNANYFFAVARRRD